MLSYCFYRIVSVSDRSFPLFGPCFVLLAAAFGASAAPYIPKDDAVVLETLPTRPGDPAAAELRRMRAAVAAAPGDAESASRLARRFFDMAMAEGDPRYVGYAEAALRAWPESASTPSEILTLHGMLRQYRHDFTRGMADFDLALKSVPANAEARAWRAAILMVQADYAAARRECELLAEHSTELHATACAAYVDATTGHAKAAYARLAAALARRSDVDPGFEVWVQTRLAEMAWRAGEPAAAERHFRRGLALGVDDNFLLAAFADFLLERGRCTCRKRRATCSNSRVMPAPRGLRPVKTTARRGNRATRWCCSRRRSSPAMPRPRRRHCSGLNPPDTRTRACAVSPQN